jgi:hypothetical protein
MPPPDVNLELEYASKIEGRTIQVLEKQVKYFYWHLKKRFIRD